MESHSKIRTRTIAVVGNPNAGKTTLFNALTGLRQKVANYPGVTVEKKEGRVRLSDGSEVILLDLPGTYSLSANSPDERIATEALLGLVEDVPLPELVICVVDATNLERNLYLVTQIVDYGIPVVVALNMMDVAERERVRIDCRALSRILGVTVISTVASKGIGLAELRTEIMKSAIPPGDARGWELPLPVKTEYEELRGLLMDRQRLTSRRAFHEAQVLLTSPSALAGQTDRFAPEIIEHVRKDHEKLDFLGFNRESVFAESRYAWIRRICAEVIDARHRPGGTKSDRIDRVLTHRFWGVIIFALVMGGMFQLIFTAASYPMELISGAFDALARNVRSIIPPGDLQDLVVNGALSGVGAVVTFLPQIVLLFLCIGLLEDSGYMARAAFIMDNLMGRVGLHGKSFIPLLSSFACAIPGIMATRTIENRNDRTVTMLIAPLMGCGARLPIYTLMIAAFIPSTYLFGFISLPGLTLVSLYLLGVLAALGMAWVFKNTLLKSQPRPFIMELPAYRIPSPQSILIQLWERSYLFLKGAGTVILGVSIVLWFLATYPRVEGASSSEQLQHSFAGQAGRFIEPVLKPLGFDWKIGIGIITSLLQREVFVGTMGTIYNIQDAGDGGGTLSLADRMRNDVDPQTGLPAFTVLTALCVMVYYVLAMQCLSTVATMRRETGGWKWPAIQFGYMTGLAYIVTFLVYHVGRYFMT
jgi:ferrous iron transport protein B